MNMKTLKKGLSWLLVTVMVLTTFFFADLGIDVSAFLDVTTLTTKLEPTIKFYVPETVYLNPVKGVGSQPYAFQYFVDCQSNGTLNVSPNQTSGLIYLSCTMPMTNVQISAGSGTTLSLQTQTDSSQVKAWTVTEQSTTSVYDGPISITATFTADGKSYSHTAYMYAYYPNLDNLVGVAGGYTYITSVGNEPDFAGFRFWRASTMSAAQKALSATITTSTTPQAVKPCRHMRRIRLSAGRR